MSDCYYYHQCLNNAKCLRCQDEQLLKLPKSAGQKKTRSSTPASTKDNSWEELEDRVAEELNRIKPLDQARRARASGALWFEKGDVLDTLLHCECKERSGNDLKGGNKSMSIQRDWLEKAKEETRFNHKTMCLPFRFKGDEQIYAIFEFNDMAELVQTAKAFMEDNERLEQENKFLKQEYKKLAKRYDQLRKKE